MADKRTLQVRLLFLAIFLITIALLYLWPSGEPVYQGRKLSAWIDKSGMFSGVVLPEYTSDPEAQSARNAVQAIGTNALPWLLTWSTTTNSRLKDDLAALLFRIHVPLPSFLYAAEFKQMRGYNGILLLGQKARPAWPIFIQWSRDPNPDVRRHSIVFLIATGADKETLEPLLNRLIRDTNHNVSFDMKRIYITLYPEDAVAAGVDKRTPEWPFFVTNAPAVQPAVK